MDSTMLLIIGEVAMLGATLLAFRSLSTSSTLAYIGMWVLYHGKLINISLESMVIWAMAVVLIAVIEMLSDVNDNNMPQLFRNYIVGGALVGAIVGLTIDSAAVICASALGAMLGGVAYWRIAAKGTHHWRLWRVVFTTALRAVVVMSIIGVAQASLLAH